MVCPKCGENLPDNARICDTCGASVHRVVPAEGTEAAAGAVKTEKTAGQFFSEMFSGKGYLIVCIAITAMRICVLINDIVLAAQLKWEDLLSNVLSLGVSLVMLVPMWMFYFRSSSQQALDYVNPLRVFRVYTLVLFGSIAVETVLAAIIMVVFSGFSLSTLIATVATAFIELFPYYFFYKFIDSLLKSAINDRVKLEGIGVIIVLSMIYGILLVVALPILLLLLIYGVAFGVGEIAAVTVLTYLVTAVFMFSANDWLRNVRRSAEQ